MRQRGSYSSFKTGYYIYRSRLGSTTLNATLSVFFNKLSLLPSLRLQRRTEAFNNRTLSLARMVSTYPLKSFRILKYLPMLPFLESGVSLVARCYSSIYLPSAFGAVHSR